MVLSFHLDDHLNIQILKLKFFRSKDHLKPYLEQLNCCLIITFLQSFFVIDKKFMD
jgi:hypothetical protein